MFQEKEETQTRITRFCFKKEKKHKGSSCSRRPEEGPEEGPRTWEKRPEEEPEEEEDQVLFHN